MDLLSQIKHNSMRTNVEQYSESTLSKSIFLGYTLRILYICIYY